MRQTPPHIVTRIKEAKKEKATKLDLSGENLMQIPELVYDLDNLEELDVSNNLILFIPDDIQRLNKLKKIDLRENDLLSSCPDISGLMLNVRVYLLLEKVLTLEHVIGLRCRHAGDRAIAQQFTI